MKQPSWNMKKKPSHCQKLAKQTAKRIWKETPVRCVANFHRWEVTANLQGTDLVWSFHFDSAEEILAEARYDSRVLTLSHDTERNNIFSTRHAPQHIAPLHLASHHWHARFQGACTTKGAQDILKHCQAKTYPTVKRFFIREICYLGQPALPQYFSFVLFPKLSFAVRTHTTAVFCLFL